MYTIRINGVSNFYCKVRNYDDAIIVASQLVEYGKLTRGQYETDEEGKYKKVGDETVNAQVMIELDKEVE